MSRRWGTDGRAEPAERPTPTIDRSPRERWLLVALGAGALIGPVDLWGQVTTPYPWAHLFNSPSVWAAAAYAYGWYVRDRRRAPIGAALLLIVAVEAYYLTDVLVRGADRANLTSGTAAVWLLAGVVAGLVFGTAGAWAVARSGWQAVVGRAGLPAVFGAEAVRNLTRIATEPRDGRPDDLGSFALLLAALAVATLVALVRGLDRRAAAQVVAVATVAAVAVGVVAGVAV